MTVLNRFRRLLAVLVVLVVIATACGGGETPDNGNAGSADTPTDSADDSDEEEIGVDETADGSDAVTAADVDEVVSGGTLRIGLQTESDSLNPTNTPINRGPRVILTAVLDTLVVIDTEGQWQNNLSESWTPTDDFLSWEMTLRDGITFTDGEPMNADAVIRNAEAFFGDPLVSLVFRPAFNADNPVEKVDDLTVRFNSSSPNAHLPSFFAEQVGMIGSPAWLDARDADPSLDQMPIGAGPYQIVERTQDQVTVLERNENYWNPDQAGIVDRIELFTDQAGADTQRVETMLAGELDITHNSDGESVLRLREAGDDITRIEDQSGEEFVFLMNAQVPPFDDIRVREAATLAFPQAQYAEFITQGTTLNAESLFSADTVWHVPEIDQIDDQPDLAAPLVAAYCSDVPDQCTDGRINIEYQHDVSDSLSQIAVIVSDAWSPFFNVELNVIPNDQHIQEVTLGLYNTATWRYHGFADPDIDSIFLSCSTISALSVNFARNCNAERDALFEQQRATTDFDERYAVWAEIQENIRDSFQYIMVTHTNWTVGAGPNVGGLCDATSPEGVALPCQDSGVYRLPQLFLTN